VHNRQSHLAACTWRRDARARARLPLWLRLTRSAAPPSSLELAKGGGEEEETLAGTGHEPRISCAAEEVRFSRARLGLDIFTQWFFTLGINADRRQLRSILSFDLINCRARDQGALDYTKPPPPHRPTIPALTTLPNRHSKLRYLRYSPFIPYELPVASLPFLLCLPSLSKLSISRK
jgi:hypothetical protein